MFENSFLSVHSVYRTEIDDDNGLEGTLRRSFFESLGSSEEKKNNEKKVPDKLRKVRK